MTVLLARLRHAARWAWAALVAAGVVAGYLLAGYRSRSSRRHGVTPLDDAVTRARQMREVAGARLAVEIAAARATAGAERDELLAALAEPDEEAQARRLIEQAKRLRGE